MNDDFSIDYSINSLYAHQIKIVDVGWLLPQYELVDTYEYEGTIWYQLKVRSTKIGAWVESNDDELWWENTPDWKDSRDCFLYTVHEKLYTYICLKWNK